MNSVSVEALALICQHLPDGILVVDAQSRVLVRNRRAGEIFGISPESIQHLNDLLPPEVRSQHAQLVVDFLKRDRPGMDRTIVARHALGHRLFLDIALSPFEFEGQQCSVARIADVTTAKESEQVRRLQAGIARHLEEAVVGVTTAGLITSWSSGAERLFGYSANEVIGRPVQVIAPPALRADQAQKMAAAMRGETVAPFEAIRRHKDGRHIHVLVNGFPVTAPNGEVIGAAGVFVDLDERTSTTLKLQHFASIVESTNDAILSEDLDGVITFWNNGAERLFGFSANEAVGSPFSLYFPDDQLEEHTKNIARIAAGETVPTFETLRKRKDGSTVPVSITASPIIDPNGRVIGVSTFIRDMTETLARAAELERSNAELEQFAYVASHDLQEPLRMVANYTELLANRYRGQLDARADKYIDYASSGAKRMQGLVTDLLAYSRVGSQGGPLVPLESGDVVRLAVRSLTHAIQEARATVDVGPLPRVLGDPRQLEQVFQNLIANAIKFRSDTPPVVRIQASPDGLQWRFRISDNGIGLDMRFATKIFQMFQRLHERERYAGSGIGLAIAKRVIERHHGRIWVESVQGKGTSFFFTLDAAGLE